MSPHGNSILWTVVGWGLVLSAAPLMILAPFGSIAAICVLCGCMGLGMAWEGRKSHGWKTVPGRVIHSEVVEHNSDFDSSANTSLEIHYTYEVDGQSFSGSRIGSAMFTGISRWFAEKRRSRYPVGATVEVYYQAENPKVSLLEPGIPGVAWLLQGGWIFAGIALYFWYERYSADPIKGWLDGVPFILLVGISSLNYFLREK